ncbi:hypothetical protein FNV43_RR02651 [Rhamnella rubrinervis]|uniref:Uncharacterized protein n=1 Tax=Rhamnella rubrinervis TaxID=2594499 RepID=A0A8K0HSX0_9ROSA|nr:hypothetical protein FNV43_RR02651 [Rhamnella rubrinervis]
MAPASANCTISNSAGHTLIYMRKNDWYGTISKPPPYPETIESGQSRDFKHVANGDGGSKSAVLYKRDGAFDWLVSWYVPTSAGNHVYTEMGPHGHFDKVDWADIERKLENGPTETVTTGQFGTVKYTATVNIEEGTNPKLMASIKTSESAAVSSE